MSQLDHPFIVKPEGLAKSKTRKAVKLTLPYLVNGDIATLIEEEDIDENLAKYLSHQMLTALMYLHSHDIAHRDIKPENICIGDDGNIRLIDFGMAHSNENIR